MLMTLIISLECAIVNVLNKTSSDIVPAMGKNLTENFQEFGDRAILMLLLAERVFLRRSLPAGSDKTAQT